MELTQRPLVELKEELEALRLQISERRKFFSAIELEIAGLIQQRDKILRLYVERNAGNGDLDG